MTCDEYQRLLELSDIALYAEIHFDFQMPSYMLEMFDYYDKYYRERIYSNLMVPRAMLFNLDGI